MRMDYLIKMNTLREKLLHLTSLMELDWISATMRNWNF